MADLVIRGMEMPKSCDVCPFVGTNDDLMSDDYRYLYCGFPYMGQYVTDYEASRHPDCPIGSLPEGHGRLIDAERYRVILCRLKERQNDDVAIHALTWAIECLDKLDTIVPAEGGGEDG